MQGLRHPDRHAERWRLPADQLRMGDAADRCCITLKLTRGSAAMEMNMKHKQRWSGIAVALSALLGSPLLTGCTDTAQARLSSYGKQQTVCLYAADGHVIHKWRSTGKVDSTDGGLHIFKDSATGGYVKVSGTAIVSAADFCK